MTRYVVLGAGAIGRGTARELAEAGHAVRLVSRSGRGGGIQGVVPVAADVTDATRLSEIAEGAGAIVNALNPAQYWKWDELWPPMAAAILEAAERSGAALVTVNNLYLYGRVDGPMREDTAVSPNGHKGEIRAGMWRDALALNDAGRIRATELRASDYVGAGMDVQSVLNAFVIKPAMRGRGGWLPMGDPDAPHTWTSGHDVAASRRAWPQSPPTALHGAGPGTCRARPRGRWRRWLPTPLPSWASPSGVRTASRRPSSPPWGWSTRCCASSRRHGTSSSGRSCSMPR